ncbi:Caspase domain-containing protein [Clostridium collagenovorans DSM 3089]|uniref:Caspase domain-containing protein n=1 Tax=Clostridium collagenovorans DSM 3089 TaxID=1121306 RepID=A0A1M5YBQ8_9CLOT|nr:caspase family protein [Clostridium collagenovorans]SHI09510.1 Caspase domain-containing protein [Clostridium collagenovorans DSM 3089]
MNIAILIGVDSYNIPGNNLPGCINDINLMSELVKNLNKFDDILILNENSNTRTTKNKIIEFFKKYDDNENLVDDFFFYFTGHGKSDENDFYYLLSDCSLDKLKQTSLENSELDTWIRKLNPKTTIKVVDACYSGMSYLKDINPMKDILNKTTKQINNCYFMYSSQFNQTSGQSEISFFTASFLNCVLKSDNGNLRYKEIIDYISDDFKKNERQTPYFVSQGDYTEIFGNINDDLKDKIMSVYNSFSNNKPKETKGNETKLIDLIKNDSMKYCSEEEMLNNIQNIQNLLNQYSIHSSELKNLFNYKCEFLAEYSDEIDLVPIGNWIKKNNNYFAKPTYRKESYKDIIQVKKKNPYGNLFGSAFANQMYEDKEVTKYRYIIDGMELTQDVPYNCMKISFIPNLQNLKYYSTYIIYAFSKTDIVFFIYTSYYKDINWKERTFITDNSWDILTISAKDFNTIKNFINKTISSIEDMILSELETKFNASTLDE